MTHSVEPGEAADYVQVLRDAIADAKSHRPSRIVSTSLGEQVVVAMYGRAFDLARAILTLIDAGLADQAASQVRSLLEVSVVLGHAATTGRPLDQLGLIVAHYSASQELGEIVKGASNADERRRALQSEIAVIEKEASAQGYKISAKQLDLVSLAEAIDRKDQVSLVYRHTSGLLHLTRTALTTRLVEKHDKFIVMPTASLWAEVSMADLGARQFTIALRSAAALLNWKSAEQYGALASRTEGRLDRLAAPIIDRARHSPN